MEALTDRQLEVLRFIARQIEDQGYPPTIREIGEALEIRSTNGVNDHLKALERKGYLTRDPVKSRALIPTPKGREALAGRASGAQVISLDTVQVDSFFLGAGRKVYGLRVQGDSMIGDGILPGDYIFVRKQLNADDGDIVVAMIDDEATVKRVYFEGDRVRFQPSNPRMAPIYVRESDFRSTMILGIVVGIYRRLQ
jgi:repressor LexA